LDKNEKENKMKKQLFYKTSFVSLIFALTLTLMGPAFPAAAGSKPLNGGWAIATWPEGIPAGEKRPIVVFLPGWGGAGDVAASVSAQNTNLVNEGYVTLAIGFNDLGGWSSNIGMKTAEGLDSLCLDATIPANCNAIVLDGESYGGIQNDVVIKYLRMRYNGDPGSAGKVLGFVSEDAGYVPPGDITDFNTGAFTRTGLADTASYSVAMIENLGDTTFPVDDCTWGNCGARVLSNAHLARGDTNVFSICPSGGEHGTRGFANWNAWVISAIKTIIHIKNGIPAFTGYSNPALTVSNTCVNTTVTSGLSVSGINILANGQPVRLRGVNMGDPFWARNPDWYPMYSTGDYATLSQNWRANVVRISIFPTQWKNMAPATLLAGLAREVDAALNNGMYVIISYHVIGWPNGWYQPAYAGNPVDTYDSSMLVATSFWTQMALTYGSDTRIIFDLWNEPVNPDDFNGVSDPNPLWPVLKEFYGSLIQTVRNNGAQNIVIATGNRWSSWLVGIKNNLLADPNVVYAYHKYSVEGANTAAEWNKDTGGLIGIKPVIVSEWGYEDIDVLNPTWPGSEASYGDPFTEWMENNKLSNLAWMYHHDWTPAFFKPDGSLTKYGIFVKNYIVKNNGAYGYDDCVPVSSELSLNVPCAIYLGNQYAFTLTYYPNPMDPNNLYWKMDLSTFGAGNSAGPCVSVTSTLALEITCAQLDGVKYGFDLEYYPNADDPSNFYWKMDLSSLMLK
jgi:endoglucanase